MIFPDFEIVDLTGPLDAFYYANRALGLTGRGKEPGYELKVIAWDPGMVMSKCGLAVHAPHGCRDIAGDLDTLIVAGGESAMEISRDQRLIDWIRMMAGRVRRVASICTGAFLLAAAGLLNNRKVTTHWMYSEQLAASYPSLRVEANRIFVRDGAIYTSGGITAGIDLALMLIEEDLGREAPRMVAGLMVVFLRRPGGGILAKHRRHRRSRLRNTEHHVACRRVRDLRQRRRRRRHSGARGGPRDRPRGRVLNPHYRSMGGLYGSEYWTYVLPRRVGAARAQELMAACRPVGTAEATAIGFVDETIPGDVESFRRQATTIAEAVARRADVWSLLREKHEKRVRDERTKPLCAYREEELAHMKANFFGPDPAYHRARENFVYKGRTALNKKPTVAERYEAAV